MGKCQVGEHCYARRLAKRKKKACRKCYSFVPHLHPERLAQPLKLRRPAMVFVGSMGDMFGDFIPSRWIERVLEVVEKASWHTFLFLTKNPKRYNEFEFPENAWLGTTINSQKDIARLASLSSIPCDNITFVSFEPLYSAIRLKFFRFKPPDWIIIGAQSRPEFQPEQEWVADLIAQAREIGAKVFLKNNLKYPEKIQEFPEP